MFSYKIQIPCRVLCVDLEKASQYSPDIWNTIGMEATSVRIELPVNKHTHQFSVSENSQINRQQPLHDSKIIVSIVCCQCWKHWTVVFGNDQGRTIHDDSDRMMLQLLLIPYIEYFYLQNSDTRRTHLARQSLFPGECFHRRAISAKIS